jgi:hypothetical protein
MRTTMNHPVTMRVLLLALFILLLANSACGSSVPVATPLWSEYNINNTGQHIGAFSVTKTINQQPPFYKGTIPLEVRLTVQPSPFYSDDERTVQVKHELNEWVTIFIYTDATLGDGIATGARTFDKSGKLLAEAKFEQDSLEGTGNILEVHYNTDGSVLFWCNSQIDLLDGFKTRETEANGAKVTDYYFIWPVSDL